jgi:hypothetical protein
MALPRAARRNGRLPHESTASHAHYEQPPLWCTVCSCIIDAAATYRDITISPTHNTERWCEHCWVTLILAAHAGLRRVDALG